MTATLTAVGGGKSPAVTATRTAVGRDGATYTVQLPLADLEPGDYVLSLEARLGRRSASRQVAYTVVAD
jgi:hypothetical protein